MQGEGVIENDVDRFLEESMDGKRDDIFSDAFPESVNIARIVVLDSCQRKSFLFTSVGLALYVNKE
jgi:hypothetical protein